MTRLGAGPKTEIWVCTECRSNYEEERGPCGCDGRTICLHLHGVVGEEFRSALARKRQSG